ncbi:uncharacterized protein Dyak_GE28046 [Drosophila yakuba]|uniref:Uncharacterized protein n=1 Tax=Drosophila yakuba TaxID=7245 RepID=A0A0R1DRL8_DROYA|nr:uncharacterized protein Dyak_GE28046 [Drosophila yakuba]
MVTIDGFTLEKSMKRLRRQRTRTQKKMHDVAATGCKLTLLHVERVRLGFPQLLALAGWQLSARAAQSQNSVLAFFCPLNRQGCKVVLNCLT